jgi:hypothetical protein
LKDEKVGDCKEKDKIMVGKWNCCCIEGIVLHRAVQQKFHCIMNIMLKFYLELI